MNVQRKRWLIAAGVALAGIALALAFRADPVVVETARIGTGTVRETIEEDGLTRVRERYVVSSPVTGMLHRLSCEAGDTIRTGDVIARIYPLPLDTRAGTEAARRLESAEAARRAADATVTGAEAVWGEARRSLERLQGVTAEIRGAISRQRIDEAETRERAARAELERARGTADAAAHDVESARAALLGTDERTSGDPTIVRAPADGRVLRLYEECERVITAGSPIVEVGDPAELEIVVDVLSEDAARLSPGVLALVNTGPAADTMIGRVDRIEPSAFTKVSPLGVEEQRVNVIVTLTTPSGVLGDRYRVETTLVVREVSGVVRVPIAALFRVGDGWGVFAVEGGRARSRAVELGAIGRREAEVRSGLAAGERVIVHPPEDVEDGSQLRDEKSHDGEAIVQAGPD